MEQLTFADYCIAKNKEIAYDVLYTEKYPKEERMNIAAQGGEFKKAWWVWFIVMQTEEVRTQLRQGMRHCSLGWLDRDMMADMTANRKEGK